MLSWEKGEGATDKGETFFEQFLYEETVDND